MLRNLGPASEKFHRSVFNWIIGKKPLGQGQYNWIFHAEDFVSLSRVDRFESWIAYSFLEVRSYRSTTSPLAVLLMSTENFRIQKLGWENRRSRYNSLFQQSSLGDIETGHRLLCCRHPHHTCLPPFMDTPDPGLDICYNFNLFIAILDPYVPLDKC
jgi:hypothetical protein